MLAPLCAKYVLVRAIALPAVVVATVAQGLCIGIKDTKTPMLAVALAAGLNLLGDLVLVSGLAMGIAGAAWATTISQYCAALLLLRVLAKRGLLSAATTGAVGESRAATNESGELAAGSGASPATTMATVRAVLSFLPFLFVMSVKVSMHNACAATAATLGGASAAAHTALMAVAWLCFTFGDVGSSLAQAYLPAFAREAPAAIDQAAASCADTGSELEDTAATAGEDGSDTRPQLLQYVYPSESGPNSFEAPPLPQPPQLPPSETMAVEQQQRSQTNFDLHAAWPTLSQLLRCTLTISAVVIVMATSLLSVFAGQISSDAAVRQQMRAALPLVIGTLSTHGTAVTLEGLLLAQKDFRGLGLTYAAVALSVAAMLALVRTSGAGLLGVWGVYSWYCGFRVIAFSAFGGLLRKRKATAV